MADIFPQGPTNRFEATGQWWVVAAVGGGSNVGPESSNARRASDLQRIDRMRFEEEGFGIGRMVLPHAAELAQTIADLTHAAHPQPYDGFTVSTDYAPDETLSRALDVVGLPESVGGVQVFPWKSKTEFYPLRGEVRARLGEGRPADVIWTQPPYQP